MNLATAGRMLQLAALLAARVSRAACLASFVLLTVASCSSGGTAPDPIGAGGKGAGGDSGQAVCVRDTACGQERQTCQYFTDACSHDCVCSRGQWQCTSQCPNECTPGVFAVGDCLRHCYCVEARDFSGRIVTECVENCGAAKDCLPATPGAGCDEPAGTVCNRPRDPLGPPACICQAADGGAKIWTCAI